MEAGSLDTQHFRIPSIFWKNLMGRGSLVSYFIVLLIAVSYRWQYVYSRWTDIFWNGCLDNQKLNIKLLYYVQLKGQRFNALSWGRLGKDQPFLVKNQLRLFALICSALLIYVSNFLIVLITIAICFVILVTLFSFSKIVLASLFPLPFHILESVYICLQKDAVGICVNNCIKPTGPFEKYYHLYYIESSNP